MRNVVKAIKIDGEVWSESPADTSLIDDIIYTSYEGRIYKRDFNGSIKASWFGIVYNATANDNYTTALLNAIKVAAREEAWLELDPGHYNLAPGNAAVTDTIRLSGAGMDGTEITLRYAFKFRGNIFLKDLSFKGRENIYGFYFDKSAPGNLKVTLQADNVRFDTFRIAIGAFNNDAYSDIGFEEVHIEGCQFNNVVKQAVQLRYRVKGLRIKGNIFDGVFNEDLFEGAINVGDKSDTPGTTGITVTENKFFRMYNPEKNGAATHAVLCYGNKNIIADNYFYDCRRAIYSRGDGGAVENNTVINSDPAKPGMLPFIFKGGSGNNHMMRGNTITGYFNSIVLIDDDDTGVSVDGNKFNVTMVGNNPYLFRFMSSSEVYTDKQVFTFINNKGEVKGERHNTFSQAGAIKELVIENNDWTDDPASQFISTRGDLKRITIKNNPVLKVSELKSVKSLEMIIENNN